MLKCVKCCLWITEKILKFINKNSYVVIAITGRWEVGTGELVLGVFCVGQQRSRQLHRAHEPLLEGRR